MLTSTVQAVVTDVDGTILPADGILSAATRASAAQLREREIPLIIATARTPPIARLESIWPAISLAVCSNGSIGHIPCSGEQVWRTDLLPDTVARILRTLTRRLPEAGCAVRDAGRSVISQNYLRARRGRASGAGRQVGTVEELIDTPASAMAVAHPHLTSDQISAVLRESGIGTDVATMSCAGPDLLDISAPLVDKGSGLSHAFAWLGIDPAQTVGFGDAANDLPMFDVVGHAVAMGNASDDVRRAADAVTLDVDGDGFSHYLRELGLVR